jgi:Holliday junction resolvase RusA-like endonuclease
MKLFIDYDFVTWNDYIKAERGSLYHANAIKQNEKHYIQYTVKDRYEGKYPVTLRIKPHFKNKRRDLDNFRLKGLIDGLVAAGVIKNDNLNCIDKIIIEAVYSDKVGVEIEIKETLWEDEEE